MRKFSNFGKKYPLWVLWEKLNDRTKLFKVSLTPFQVSKKNLIVSLKKEREREGEGERNLVSFVISFVTNS